MTVYKISPPPSLVIIFSGQYSMKYKKQTTMFLSRPVAPTLTSHVKPHSLFESTTLQPHRFSNARLSHATSLPSIPPSPLHTTSLIPLHWGPLLNFLNLSHLPPFSVTPFQDLSCPPGPANHLSFLFPICIFFQSSPLSLFV
ncbi:hypothetical protein BRADI_2g35747v3 [Brachypodium distachyon]|uniref:Uncharacterized protein n=1 Tax=Brachypodium distachyon TaxID=15368 RepID=A0A2K2DBZ9_BRADI|nr:hypothetical protein BRADI_2g35747v3 [Brachypodium distachyon]